MFSFLDRKFQYVALPDNVSDEELKVGDHQPRIIQCASRRNDILYRIFTACCLSLISVMVFVNHFSRSLPATVSHSPIPSSPVVCQNPAVRQEWRLLLPAQQDAYIAAVRCLTEKPSKLRASGSLYDDFPWVHQLVAPRSHMSAPFLPWHRYFVHAYENALKSDCGYSGSLPYWDWSQDWQNFHDAPVWSADSGFGGNGETDGATSVGEGRCVTDGPFAGLEARFFGDSVKPHCLSRGFARGDELKNLTERIRPDAIEELVESTDGYDDFATELEWRAHSFIKGSIKGDFDQFTGPYDPVFFLHHVNLDRLWAKWQEQKQPLRQMAYSGRQNNLTNTPATLDDWLDVGGLLHDIRVAEMMTIDSGILCYQY